MRHDSMQDEPWPPDYERLPPLERTKSLLLWLIALTVCICASGTVFGLIGYQIGFAAGLKY